MKRTLAKRTRDRRKLASTAVDEGESWSEGTREDAIVFKDIPAGDYYLNIEFELGATATMSGIIPLSIQWS